MDAENSALNKTDFSIDSLQIGDSTRSLLSPLYGQYSEDDDGKNVKNASYVIESQSESPTNGSARKKKAVKKPTYENSIHSMDSSSCSSYTVQSSDSSHTSIKCKSSSESPTEKQMCLSPWEQWLLLKVVEDKKRLQVERQNTILRKEMKDMQMNEKNQKEKRDEENRKEWLKSKRNEEKLRNELALRLERKQLQEEKEQNRIKTKAKESFEKWFKEKECYRKEQRKEEKMKEKNERENDIKRKMDSEQAYKQWLQKSKLHQKSKNYHFGYLENKVTGYYDWTTYPMPSYCNPQPWVPPKVHTQCQRKIKLQNPSPPLLFKDLEAREKNAKQNITKL